MIVVLAYTGIRRAELRGLQPGDIESNTERLIVRRGKGGKLRIVFVPQTVARDMCCQRPSENVGK
jgi:integrase